MKCRYLVSWLEVMIFGVYKNECEDVDEISVSDLCRIHGVENFL